MRTVSMAYTWQSLASSFSNSDRGTESEEERVRRG